MPWFRIDDSFESHPKVKALSPTHRLKVIGLWTLAGAWCARHLTDGFVPNYMLAELLGSKREANALVEVGLWMPTDGGFTFKDWHDFQPTRSKVLEDRDAAKSRMQAARERKRGQSSENVRANESERQRDRSPDVRSTQRSLTPTRPDPTRPDPEKHLRAAAADRATEPDFEQFWELYPRKVAKPRARTAYIAARKRATADTILAGLRAHLPALLANEPRFQPYPATWLNGDRFADPAPAAPMSRVQSHMALAKQLAEAEA